VIADDLAAGRLTWNGEELYVLAAAVDHEEAG
jgi:hypothetical protein